MQNLKVYLYVLILTSVTALVLSLLQESLKDVHAKNEAFASKKDILASIMGAEARSKSDEEVETIFSTKVEALVIDAEGKVVKGKDAAAIKMADEMKKSEEARNYPLYIYNGADEKVYILSVYGNGLWDKIWGFVALKGDLNTLAGVSFDHKSETPGLGALIKDSENFKSKFVGTKIFNEEGDYVSVKVRKGGAVDKTHEVDGITGATVTSDGVTDMLYNSIAAYLPYFETLKPGLMKGRESEVEEVEEVTTEENDTIEMDSLVNDSTSVLDEVEVDSASMEVAQDSMQ